MKLRIKGNSVRLRLNRFEVGRLSQGQSVQQATSFAAGRQLRSLIQPTDADAILMTFDGEEIALHIPQALVDRWANSDEVTVSALQRVDERNQLTILLEKDFACLHPGHESEAGAYPHPGAASSRCG